MTTFTITSFNALGGMTTDGKPFPLAEVAVAFDTDLVAIQELWEPTGTDHDLWALAADAGYELVHVPLSGATMDPKFELTVDPDRIQGTWGVVLLSRLPIRSVRIVDLGRLIERWDLAERFAILANIDIGGTPVTVATHHLSFVLPNALAQLRRLSGYIPNHQPSLVVGDCNQWGPLAASMVHRHRRAVKGRTWPAHRPHSQLDHILVSPEIEVIRSAVLPPEGSDHLPIQATLRVKPAS